MNTLDKDKDKANHKKKQLKAVKVLCTDAVR